MKRTSERKKGMDATRLGTSTDSEDVPQIAKGGEPITAQTPSSVREDSEKAGTGRMPLTSERSVSQVEGSGNEKGQMSAAWGSAELDRPEKGSPARRRPASGSENRLSILQREDAEEFGEFLHEGKAVAPPIMRSFEKDALLKRPPPDFALGQEHWLGLHDEIREKLWQVYRLIIDHGGRRGINEDDGSHLQSSNRADREEGQRGLREGARAKKEGPSKPAGRSSSPDVGARPCTARHRGTYRWRRSSGKELKEEAAAASRDQRETYDQYHRLCREWRTEETKSRWEFSATFHQDWMRESLKLLDLLPSVRPFNEDSKLAEPQRSAAPPPTNAETARTEVSAWVGSTSERRPTQETRRTPQSRGLLSKFVDYSKTLERWKFLSLRELEAEQMEPPAQRAIAELGRVLENDLSWRSSFPGLVDTRTAMLRELWDHMGSFSQELHQAVWDVLQNLARATPG